jgi:hypothetical protein
MNGLKNFGWDFHFVVSLLVFAAAVRGGTISVDARGAADFRSLAAAVEAAHDGDVIVVAPGTHIGGGNRNVVINGKVLTIRSRDPNDPAVAAATIINCQGRAESPHRAFEIAADTGGSLTLEGLTIINGYHLASGGAVACEGGTLHARNCTFAHNTVQWWGGAVYCEDGQATFEGCTFSDNISEAMHGGALFGTDSALEATSCTFERNTGGAIENHGSTLTVSGCVFQENTGLDGAAIHSRTGSDTNGPAYVHLTRCSFITNTATSSGGALYNRSIEATIDCCTFIGNAAGQDGGAVYNYQADPVLRSCVFVGNAAAGAGGAVRNWYESDADILSCTFVANSAAVGGAIANERDGSSFISHCILWDNSARQGRSLYLGYYEWGSVYPAAATVEFSDVAGGPEEVGVEAECTLNWASNNIDADPLFTGPVQGDYYLSPDSPCINTGDPNYVPEPNVTDLDGNARCFGATVDMGAYEFQGLGAVYRFWSPSRGRHFYTIRGAERDKLIDEFAHLWQFEGTAYYAFHEPVTETMQPVHRFWSDKLQSHFWTIRESEREKLVNKMTADWTYEGIAFYAYPQHWQPLGTVPVYRFWSGKLGHHFYTIDENEKNKLMENDTRVWVFEGVAWYAYAQPRQPRTAPYAFTGGPGEARYALALEASIDGRDVQINTPELTLMPATTRMQMTIDFDQFTVMLDELHVQTDPVEHDGIIREGGPTGLEIPFRISVQAHFEAGTRRGPFTVDPQTLLFADYTDAAQGLAGEDDQFTWRGSVMLAGQMVDFDLSAPAVQLQLNSAGTFESLHLLPEGIYARLPFTFQWQRQYVKDLLAEASVNGRLVQLYVTYAYVGTDGLWRGEVLQ